MCNALHLQVISSVIPNDDFGGFEPLRQQVSPTTVWGWHYWATAAANCHSLLHRNLASMSPTWTERSESDTRSHCVRVILLQYIKQCLWINGRFCLFTTCQGFSIHAGPCSLHGPRTRRADGAWRRHGVFIWRGEQRWHGNSYIWWTGEERSVMSWGTYCTYFCNYFEIVGLPCAYIVYSI